MDAHYGMNKLTDSAITKSSNKGTVTNGNEHNNINKLISDRINCTILYSKITLELESICFTVLGDFKVYHVI